MNHKILFFSTLILGTLISISSFNWMGMWIGLEINLLSIIPLMQNKMNILSTEASIKYFITQAMASSILIASIVLMMMKTGQSSMLESNPLSLMMNSSLIMKMGMTPFHFWFTEVMEGLSWMNCLIMMTWQKLAPLVLVMYNSINSMFMETIIIMGMLISGISSFNQTSMRKLLTYSSINHMSWMITSMMMNQMIWLLYFLVYVIMSTNIIILFNMKKINSINQMYNSMNNNSQMKLLFSFNFLNMSGIPPFLGFLPKWLTMEAVINNKLNFLLTIMVISTLLMIYIYLKISMSALLLSINVKNWNLMSNLNKSFKTSLFNFMSLMTLMIMTIVFNFV